MQQQQNCNFEEHGQHHARIHRNQRRRGNDSTINGTTSGGEDNYDDNEDDDDEDEIVDTVDSSEERVSLSVTSTNNAAETVTTAKLKNGNEERRPHRRDASLVSAANVHSMKIPSKLRKIDRDSVKLKDKLTSDGIKSTTPTTTDGSYQCQFCDKSFPRLGYLKKHEQVSAQCKGCLLLLLLLFLINTFIAKCEISF